MAKESDNNQSSIVNSQSKKVWRIFHFTKRYELPEDVKICRRSGLQYVKLFVGISGGDEAVGYEQQMAMICNGDGSQASMIEGLYGKLVRMAAKHSFYRRGYLLDAAGGPLTISQLAKLLNFPQPTMRKWIKRFEDVRLLERVEMPDFEGIKQQTDEDGDTKKRNKRPQKKGNSGEDRKTPEGSGKKRAPLKNGKTTKSPNGDKNKRKLKATNGKTTTVDSKKKNNGNSKEKPPQAPTTAPEPLPSEPCESDLGGDPAKAGCKTPQGGYRPASSRQRLRLTHSAGQYETCDVIYGIRVYKALGFTQDIENDQAKREITSFASKHHECRCRLQDLPPPEIDRLSARGLNEAEKICRGLKKKKLKILKEEMGCKLKTNHPGKIWNWLMDRMCAAVINVKRC